MQGHQLDEGTGAWMMPTPIPKADKMQTAALDGWLCIAIALTHHEWPLMPAAQHAQS